MGRLRSIVEKWLVPLPDPSIGSLRVQRLGRAASRDGRCVRIEVCGMQGTACLHFFRHGDGCWHVFPPPRPRPAMGTDGVSLAAANARLE
ncbi:hypothetical protein WKR88_01195 [Trinickia caryophylli]|uniref:Uncharacterized protein n=1 Tax=Trinickia caryophylli TaxID=28094 RepID=A0A1X7CH39_TRICW|nr:hypothetical protein [Trinickia caryophylli]PMS11577.1 hypothetical protein C0Z17_13990 [Trinickia caryophylli]TRX19870.1 hypothetical protein FNF07_17785 [Trinickia caryophylli]WQE12796.1 hypothetical protein U0034_05170 [Trinickia caryophylli]SME96434.1 hypothetical protein SAMN06295900_101373 [Trinickia caryophylli]GLU30512.1 hypothetical protein Busp01_03540 [Trinickia caryophylli]